MRIRTCLLLSLLAAVIAGAQEPPSKLETEAKRAFDSGLFAEAGDKYCPRGGRRGSLDGPAGGAASAVGLVVLHRRQREERARGAQGGVQGPAQPDRGRRPLQPRLREDGADGPRGGHRRARRGGRHDGDQTRGAREAAAGRCGRRRRGPEEGRRIERPGAAPIARRGLRPPRPGVGRGPRAQARVGHRARSDHGDADRRPRAARLGPRHGTGGRRGVAPVGPEPAARRGRSGRRSRGAARDGGRCPQRGRARPPRGPAPRLGKGCRRRARVHRRGGPRRVQRALAVRPGRSRGAPVEVEHRRRASIAARSIWRRTTSRPPSGSADRWRS